MEDVLLACANLSACDSLYMEFYFNMDTMLSAFKYLSTCIAMVSLTESEAVFNERSGEVGLDRVTLQSLKDQGITTMAKLAFAVGQPGETPGEDAIRGLAAAGADPAGVRLGVVSSLRRLIFETQTLLVSQVKNLIEHKADETKLELAPAERTFRIAEQRGRMTGLTLTGELECAYCCYDLVMKMSQQNAVVYLPPHKFVSRKSELGMDKPKKELTIDTNSTITVKDKSQDLTCSTATDLMLQEALVRRALALDLVGVTAYHRVEAYNRFLMGHLQSTPPAGYSKVSIQQILRADKEAWLRLAEKLSDGIKRKADGTLPLDAEWMALQSDPRVVFHLLPLPLGNPGSSSDATAISNLSHEISAGNKGDGKGHGKGKLKRKWRAPKNMPAPLVGKRSETSTGKPLCWNYNLEHGCKSGIGGGGKCDKGRHLCMEPGCQKPHPLHKHGTNQK